MLELLLIILLICVIAGPIRSGWPADPLGIILLVLIVVIVLSLFTPLPYHRIW
ncbi:MAG TPA: hypothetical protein VGM38_02410 [Pseudolysinimonas sp.]|jgi:hypothetical protein